MNYIQHEGKVVNPGEKFKHVMAITLNPVKSHSEGLLRCIESRTGSVHIDGFIDRSRLYKLAGSSLESFKITEPLIIKNEEEVIKKLSGLNGDCIGFEDPDIWIDPIDSQMHVYFTIPILFPSKAGNEVKVNLGHAVGDDLDSLVMTEPVLFANDLYSAKEVSIAPINKEGVRYNLIESRDLHNDTHYSVVQVAIAKEMSGQWEYGDIAFHPKDTTYGWIAEDASPGPLFSDEFIDLGEGKMLGIMNGRAKSSKLPDGVKRRGTFSVGLFIYNYENGKIEWVSPEPLIIDSEAVTITFASQFVLTKPGEGILYAHVDDSFVRAYTLQAEKIRKLLPIEYN